MLARQANSMSVAGYFSKMKGENRRAFRIRGAASVSEIAWAWVGSALGIGIIAVLSNEYFEPADSLLLIGSFGASAVLVYAAIAAPLSQPRNLIGGHIISAIIGVALFQIFGDNFVGAGLAVSLAIAAMMATDTLHPPGGATALIAVIGGEVIHDLGLFYVLAPAALGAVILLLIALIVNNISSSRRYPVNWW
ncbi:MAG: HPP family protein [SAR202 cluster bacterium]|nr:HPP family protein [SAR202 cluster bacterium]